MALKRLYKDQFQPCVLRHGKFIPYSMDAYETGDTADSENSFNYLPDSSFNFPSANSLEPIAVKLYENIPPQSNSEALHKEMRFGDTLISVGLDWDWETQRIDKIFYDLKTNRGINIISCCYDLIPIIFPQYCVGDVSKKFMSYFTNLTWSSSLVLCISKATERDYRNFSHSVGLPQIPTVIIPLGNNLPKAGEMFSNEIQSLLDSKFILFVSTIERRKNHEVLYRAYHLLSREKRNGDLPKLVFVGMPGWGVQDLLKDIELDPLTQNMIVQLNHVNDAELRVLYEKCQFFVYPSLYEGWGLPIAEALALGKTVIASATGSIPEVGGDLVQYIDPWNPSAWADAIYDLSNNAAELENRSLKIKNSFTPISWNKTAQVVAEAVRNVENNQLTDDVRLPGYDLKTQVGLPCGHKIISTGEKGVLAFGPYISAPEGPLSATLEFSEVSESSGNITIRLSYAKGSILVCQKILTTKDLKETHGIVELKPTLVEKDVEDLEIFVFVEEMVRLSLDRVVFHFSDSSYLTSLGSERNR